MERDFAAYLFTLFCPVFTSGASFSIAHEYSVRNLNYIRSGSIYSKMCMTRAAVLAVVGHLVCRPSPVRQWYYLYIMNHHPTNVSLKVFAKDVLHACSIGGVA